VVQSHLHCAHGSTVDVVVLEYVVVVVVDVDGLQNNQS
jgi:hypothetical protein